MRNNTCGFAVVALIAVFQGCASAPSSRGSGAVVAADHFVPHTSTLQSIKGQRVDEIASAIVFLASGRASYISGTILTVDGG